MDLVLAQAQSSGMKGECRMQCPERLATYHIRRLRTGPSWQPAAKQFAVGSTRAPDILNAY
jgi:hypothetical protein